jgi:hypothetical protein
LAPPATPGVNKTYRAATLAVGLLLAACGGSSHSGSAPKVPEVVAGSNWPGISVSTATASAEVPVDARRNLAPLLATRVFNRPAPLAEYGLDHPQATLGYRGPGGQTVDVDVGALNFDRHFVYVQRRGQPAVYLVPADTLRATLAVVGIDLKPPE